MTSARHQSHKVYKARGLDVAYLRSMWNELILSYPITLTSEGASEANP